MFRLKDGILAFLWIINFTYVYPAPRLKESRKDVGVRNKRQVDGDQLAPLPLQQHSNNNHHQTDDLPNHNSNSNPAQNERSRDYTGIGTRDYQYRYETGNGGGVGTGGYRVTLVDGLDPNAPINETQHPPQQNSQTHNGFGDDIDLQFRTFLQTEEDDDRYHHGDNDNQNQERTSFSQRHGDETTRTESQYHTQQTTLNPASDDSRRYSTNSPQDGNYRNYPSNSRGQGDYQNTGGDGSYLGSGINYDNRRTHQTGHTNTGTRTGYYNTQNGGTNQRSGTSYYNPQTGGTNNQGSGTSFYNTQTGERRSNVGSGFQDSRTQYSGNRNFNSFGQYPIYNQEGYNQGRYVSGGRPIPNIGVMSNDQTCPNYNYRVYINSMECSQAVDSLGSFICYNYERVSRECCEKCLPLKRRHNQGCEYGDRSYQCRNIEPFDCYVERTRHICCDQCRRYAMQRDRVVAGCEYGDLTPRCQTVRDRKHLCYLPENQRLCCVTCPSLEDQQYPGCKWGDQNPDLCEPFTREGALRINCYLPVVRQVCCSTCRRLSSRIDNLPGCEYGDKPVRFNTVRGLLDCGNYVRTFGLEVCDIADVNRHCCHTCHRYRTARG